MQDRLSSQAYAAGGAAGANGTGGWVGDSKVGKAGLVNAAADGEDGGSVTGFSNGAPSGSVTAGENGKPPISVDGGSGAGGHGGGSFIGGTSTGGAGGVSASTSASTSASGGNGGEVSGNTITIEGALTLTGAAGGNGGALTAQDSFGGTGAAGHGGGSVFGGISTGGAGGRSEYESSSASGLASANGGNGGEVSGHEIKIEGMSSLVGATGGNGGSSSFSSFTVLTEKLGAGAAGHGGGSVFGGISTGGAGGYSSAGHYSTSTSTSASANGGNGGEVSGNKISMEGGSSLTGAEGGNGGGFSSSTHIYSNSSYTSYGGTGTGGHGGGSVFGGISTGGAGGFSQSFIYSTNASANGGNGGEVSGNEINLEGVSSLTGAAGGNGGSYSTSTASASASDLYGGAGAGGHGGSSVFGGVSTGGAGGFTGASSNSEKSASSANGGNGGNVLNNLLTLKSVQLNGSSAVGGNGGSFSPATSSSSSYSYSSGGAGAAGHGGGSVFGGISTGGAGGFSAFLFGFNDVRSESFANGGDGGNVLSNQLVLESVQLNGSSAAGGNGGALTAQDSFGGAGAAGHGGGAVFGGISTGGAGGLSSASVLQLASPSAPASASANGGNGGNVSGHTIKIINSTLTGAAGGAGGSASSYGGAGAAGHGGGSVFGGISTGGAGGVASSSEGVPHPEATASANGGNGGDVLNNKITLAGVTKLSGDIYGGISQGGDRGNTVVGTGAVEYGEYGQGGRVENNTITLIRQDITIGGSIYGGKSINGDGSLSNERAFSGNTLNLEGYKGSVQGIYNIQNFNWVLPKDVVNGTKMVAITGNTPVQLDNTKHTAAMYNDGNRLSTGDQITLIDKAQGSPTFASDQVVKQGHFILYDAKLDVQADALVLTIGRDGTRTVTGLVTDPGTAGRINPTAKAFLEGRAASLALANQAADMVSDNAMGAARMSAGSCNASISAGGSGDCNAGMFVSSSGGSSRYETGSHVDVQDINLALGVSKPLALKNSSAAMVGAFVEYGQGSYDTYNNFGALGKVRGSGDTDYYGVGVLMHIAGFGVPAASDTKLGAQAGPYLQGALRAGRTKNTFGSSDLDDGMGGKGRYASKTSYFSAMVGVGHVFNLNAHSAVDLYGRYTWGKLSSDTAMVGNSALEFGASESSRLRLGARYSYVSSDTFKPYVGLAAEREFKGNASGSSSGLDIPNPSLKGTTAIVEIGASMKPWASKQALSLDVGLQGYFGKREGASGSIKVKYAF